MDTNSGAKGPPGSEVRTVLQYLADTNRQLRVFYVSALTAGLATNRLGIACIALVIPALPQLLMILLSVVDRDAIQAIGSDFTNHLTVDDGVTESLASDGEIDAPAHGALPICSPTLPPTRQTDLFLPVSGSGD